jgi:hypothetical protein
MRQERRVDDQGYVHILVPEGTPGRHSNGYVLEHRLVMSEMMGRPLLPEENVHHKNGVRFDNSPDNLELWVTTQPSGQRPDDLCQWAIEILRRYRPEVPSDTELQGLQKYDTKAT